MEEARSSRKTCTQRRGDLPTVMEGIRPPRGAIRGARSSRRCHRLRKTRKVAPLQREKQPVTPVVTKLFKTFPEFEKAIAQRHQSRIQPAPEEEDLLIEDLE
ncbi:Hypothetical predicted protein [Podarcis lilfordi]|uniref:Uncharacterized protein n=1 Tax=Podarcis lilfordi TaxID=74358 RepID=A0AA35KX96_9SAUR|nr:Hypothetical predicted protein [Podarcis lilfordi]